MNTGVAKAGLGIKRPLVGTEIVNKTDATIEEWKIRN